MTNVCTEVTELFLIAGHSFIPPDKVFRNIEKKVWHMEVIIEPKEYTNIIGNLATVAMLGGDCQVFYWKQARKNNINHRIHDTFSFRCANGSI
jgi:hypothetical protein